jgi:hypothetical protein
MTQQHDIGKNPSSALHPSYPLRITFDDVYIYSVESFILSLQIRNEKHQAHCCSLDPSAAFSMITKMRDKAEGLTGIYEYFWCGDLFKRDEQRFDILLDRFFSTLLEFAVFADELAESVGSHLATDQEALFRVSHIVSCDEFTRRVQAVRDTKHKAYLLSPRPPRHKRLVSELYSTEEAPL